MTASIINRVPTPPYSLSSKPTTLTSSSPSPPPSPRPSFSSPLALDRFPRELRIIIFHHIQHKEPSALFNLISTCQEMYDHFTPYLYEKSSIDKSNASRLFHGIIHHERLRHHSEVEISLEDQTPEPDFAIVSADIIALHNRKISLLGHCKTLIIHDVDSVKNISSALRSTENPCEDIEALQKNAVGKDADSLVDSYDSNSDDSVDDDQNQDDEVGGSKEENDHKKRSSLFPRLSSLSFENTCFFDLWHDTYSMFEDFSEILFSNLRPDHVCAGYDSLGRSRIYGMMIEVRASWNLNSFTWHNISNPEFGHVNPARYLNYHLSSDTDCSVHHPTPVLVDITTEEMENAASSIPTVPAQ